MPTSFETPVTPAAEDTRSAAGPRYAATANEPAATDVRPTEPARLMDQTATPLVSAPAPAPRIKEAPSYTADQLNSTLAAAREAQAGLVTGDLNDRTVQRTKGLSYSKICDLAEAATFVANLQASESADVEPFFRETLAENRIRDEVARIVPIWITSTHRRHGGIFFAGTLTSRVERGAVTECEFAMTSGASQTVLVPPSLADRLAAARRTVIVVGSLIDRPAERIGDYTGNAPQVVWASSLIPLGQ
jgi:hypothetical protein